MDYKKIADRVGPRTGAAQEWVFRIIRDGIISGEIPSGTQLKQDEISAALNVSHIPVREALRRLEARGLVQIHTNRGATVRTLNRNTILDMMEVRATLAVMKLKNSAPLLTEEDYRTMADIIEEQKKVTELFETEALNYRFHEVLGSHDDNSIADMFMYMIHENIDRYVRHGFYDTAEHRAVSISEHEKIMQACREKDYDRACELLREHILNAKQYIQDII